MKYLLWLGLPLILIGCGPKNEPSSSAAPRASPGNHDADGPITQAQLGMQLYPGARIVTSGETAEVISANLETSDPAEKVIAFYENELGAARGSGGTVKVKKNGRTFVVSAAPAGSGTAISIMVRK